MSCSEMLVSGLGELRLGTSTPRSTLLTYDGVYPASLASPFWDTPATSRQCFNSAMKASDSATTSGLGRVSVT